MTPKLDISGIVHIFDIFEDITFVLGSANKITTTHPEVHVSSSLSDNSQFDRRPQLLSVLISGDPAVLQRNAFADVEYVLPLQLTPAAANSRMLGSRDVDSVLQLHCHNSLTEFQEQLAV